MQYRTFGKTGESVSILGYGCMRFPQKGPLIDEARTEKQVISAIEAGVNYFDTAYIYNGGRSEVVLGNILAKGYRDRVLIADKIPPYLATSRESMDKILNTQLDRLKTDRIDFYLVHSLSSFDGWKAFRALGFDAFIRDAVASGKVRHVGFSWHGNLDDFKRVVDDWDWAFVQIQYNYFDEHDQAGREGMMYASERGLGVAVMEPLRGGLLSGRMPQEAQDVMNRASIRRSAADWAFRWLWDQPEVSLLLSGMNEEAHIEENLRIADEATAGCLTAEDSAVLDQVRTALSSRMKVSCTACRYCMPCPFGVDIPGVFQDYNAYALFGAKRLRFSHTMTKGGAIGGTASHAALCTDCGKCERLCPQHIPIRAKLKEAHKSMYISAMDLPLKLVRGVMAGRIRRAARKNPGNKEL